MNFFTFLHVHFLFCIVTDVRHMQLTVSAHSCICISRQEGNLQGFRETGLPQRLRDQGKGVVCFGACHVRLCLLCACVCVCVCHIFIPCFCTAAKSCVSVLILRLSDLQRSRFQVKVVNVFHNFKAFSQSNFL